MKDKTTPEENTKASYLRIIFKYFLEHPAIGGSCIYIAVSVIGVIYSWTQYYQFQINIFDYAEANDFLLIAFKEPLMCVLILEHLCLAIPAFIFIPRFFKHTATLASNMLAIGFLLALLPFIYFSALHSTNMIKKEEPSVTVLYEVGKEESSSVVKKLESSLIGSTEKFMFFYNHSDKCTVVIPITKIISITTGKKQHEN